MPKPAQPNRYKAILEKIFFDGYRPSATEVPFERDAIKSAAKSLEIELPDNIGDLIYTFRYRVPMPDSILKTQPKGKEWVIEGIGRSRYRFKLEKTNRIAPNPSLVRIKVPDATPEIIAANALNDEQALLAKVRYNRLVDIFLGIASYSLQNHLRTTVSGLGQIEIDEVYIGIDRNGAQYIFPVQAKGGKDQLSSVQMRQDIRCCREHFPNLICRAISCQFIADDLIAMFELKLDDDEIKIVDEKHYKLVAASDISANDLVEYSRRNV